MRSRSAPADSHDVEAQVEGAKRLLEVAQRRADALVEGTRQQNVLRLEQARTKAAELRTSNEESAELVLISVQEANASRLRAADSQANKLVAFARDRVRELLGESEVSPTPARRTTDADAGVTLRLPAPGTVDLVAKPFTHFSQLAEFMRTLRRLPGVESVELRQFFDSAVRLRVRYDDPVPLAARLRQLRGLGPLDVTGSASRIEINLRAATPPPPPGRAVVTQPRT